MVTIRRYGASRVCDVVVVVRGQEMVIRCPSYSHALKWAALERKSYKIPDPIITDFSDNEEPDDVPLFLRPDRKLKRPQTYQAIAYGRTWRFNSHARAQPPPSRYSR